LKKIHDISNISNPYAKEYMKQREDNIFRSYEYISWIGAKHREYRKINEIDEFYPIDDNKFLKWLKGDGE
jgi:hypothetical protein